MINGVFLLNPLKCNEIDFGGTLAVAEVSPIRLMHCWDQAIRRSAVDPDKVLELTPSLPVARNREYKDDSRAPTVENLLEQDGATVSDRKNMVAGADKSVGNRFVRALRSPKDEAQGCAEQRTSGARILEPSQENLEETTDTESDT